MIKHVGVLIIKGGEQHEAYKLQKYLRSILDFKELDRDLTIEDAKKNYYVISLFHDSKKYTFFYPIYLNEVDCYLDLSDKFTDHNDTMIVVSNADSLKLHSIEDEDVSISEEHEMTIEGYSLLENGTYKEGK